jgi:hypothetical protein
MIGTAGKLGFSIVHAKILIRATDEQIGHGGPLYRPMEAFKVG